MMLQDDDSEELEDMIINPTDSVVVYACTEDEVSYLEVSELVVLWLVKLSPRISYRYILITPFFLQCQVWVIEDADSSEMNMYPHHNIIIPAFPLCTAWLDCPLKGGERGSFARYLFRVYLCWSSCLIVCFVQFNFSPSPAHINYLNWRAPRKLDNITSLKENL